MSKRPYSAVSTSDADNRSVARMIEHADELLKAATALKNDLVRHSQIDTEQGVAHQNGEQRNTILDIVQHNNTKITRVTQSLDQLANQHDQDAAANKNPTAPKAIKLSQENQVSQTSIPVPCVSFLSRWVPEDLSNNTIPKLPFVGNPELEKAALTHPGMVENASEMSYERFEWLGDAYLELLASVFIFQTFPNLSAGRSAQLRERLINNKTLGGFTLKYQLNQRARFPAEYQLGGRAGGSQVSQKQKDKVLGDILESYVAAIVLGSPEGLASASSWLKKLWAGILAQELREEFAKSKKEPGKEGTQLNAKVLLSQQIGCKGISISYKDMGEPQKDKRTKLPWYKVGVFIDGLGENNLLLAEGGALQKKEAGAKAAQQALGNKQMMDKLRKRKQEYLDAVGNQKPF